MLAYTFYETDNRVMRYAETLVKRGDQVDTISLRKKGQSLYNSTNGVNLYRIQKRSVNEKSKLAYLAKILLFWISSFLFVTIMHLKNPYDVIHVHSVPDFEVFAALIPKILGAKVILDIHDIVPEFYASKFSTSDKSFLFRGLLAVERLSIAFANHVIISNHIWEKKLTARSVSPKKCTTIINYPDTSIFHRRKRNQTENGNILIYPGTLNWHQGLDVAINAFALIEKRIPNWQFHIYGAGPYKEALKHIVNGHKLEIRVFLKEFLPIRQIANVMANSHLGIIPKRNDPFGGEAFSTKTLEFMSLGIPILLSRTKIDQYYFTDNLVIFFDPGSVEDLAKAMLSAMRDEGLRNRLAKNALEFVQHHTWDTKKHIYLNIIDALLK